MLDVWLHWHPDKSETRFSLSSFHSFVFQLQHQVSSRCAPINGLLWPLASGKFSHLEATAGDWRKEREWHWTIYSPGSLTAMVEYPLPQFSSFQGSNNLSFPPLGLGMVIAFQLQAPIIAFPMYTITCLFSMPTILLNSPQIIWSRMCHSTLFPTGSLDNEDTLEFLAWTFKNTKYKVLEKISWPGIAVFRT